VVLDRGTVAFEEPLGELLGEELLAACGLEVPPLSRVVASLRAAGVALDARIAEPCRLAEALWR
jgi:hypothetical protein